MPFGFLQRGSLAEHARRVELSSYSPKVELEGLLLGVDNVRHDVSLSPRFTELARQHIFKLITRYGEIEAVAIDDRPSSTPPQRMIQASQHKAGKNEVSDFKSALLQLHLAALTRAKTDGRIQIDLLARIAMIKFLRGEMNGQFAQALERCRARLKSYESPRSGFQSKAVEMREAFANFQIQKKSVLRRVGQDLFFTLRDVEKESLARTRRSLFGEVESASYDLLLNRLLFTDEGQDDLLNAEHYVMFGNYESDPDRFSTMQGIASEFLRSLDEDTAQTADTIDARLNVPENAQELFASGTPDEAAPKGKSQRALLGAWLDLLEKENVLQHVIAAYEVVPLLAQYSPPINAQQLKNSLISKTERARVENLLEQQGRLSTEPIGAAVRKVEGCRGAERAKLAARFFGDFVRYHRDLRRFEAVSSAMDSVNVIASEKLRELSAINNTLYEFLLPEEQKQGEEKVVRHVILKADVRDSTTLTRTLYERGLNPASFFSLNFYEPINKLLPKYEASTVFIEGDAVILALFEREGEPGFAVGRTCILAKEMIAIVGAYNAHSRKQGLPPLELGIGISFQDSAPMYLMYGSQRIMISKALNESDRLSGCSKGARKFTEGKRTPFSVFSIQTVEDKDTTGNPDEFLVRYNIGGILMSAACFEKLKQEISLKEVTLRLPTIWAGEPAKLYSGIVPLGNDLFHKIVVREGTIPHVDAGTVAVKSWTRRKYYEVCVNQEVYEAVEKSSAAAVTV